MSVVLWPCFRAGMLKFVLPAMAASFLIDHTFIGRHLEFLNLDVWLLAQRPPQSSPVTVVEISEENYRDRNLFDGTSPLDVGKVLDLMWAVALSGAKTIVLDIDTSVWTAEDRRQAALAAKGAKIVWARAGRQQNDGVLFEPVPDRGPSDCFGAPMMTPDDDGVIRRLLPYQDQSGDIVPNLAIAASAIHTDPEKGCRGAEEEARKWNPGERMIVNFRGGREAFIHVYADQVMNVAPKSEAWRAANPIRGKIVLIGGSYGAARDKYRTPAGYLDGVDVLAHGIESADETRRVEEVNPFLFEVIDILLGAALTALGCYGHRISPWFSLIAITLSALLISFGLFQIFHYFASFAPVALGVFAHEVFEAFGHQEHPKKKRH